MSLDLDAIKARAEAATSGPWTAATAPAEGSDESHEDYLLRALYGKGLPLWVTWAPNDTSDGFAYLVPAVTGDGPTSEANAAFIAHARQDVPALIAEVNRLRSTLADFIDPDPCSFDHHGYCQAHSWLTTSERCPQARAKDLLGGAS